MKYIIKQTKETTHPYLVYVFGKFLWGKSRGEAYQADSAEADQLISMFGLECDKIEAAAQQ